MHKRIIHTILALSLINVAAAAADFDPSSSMSKFEKDREAILAMSGEYRVSFRFDETLTLDAEATASKRHVSNGFEKVYVIADKGEFIQMQHLLVVETDSGDQHVVKHWRQDWQYEPKDVLVYRGHGDWEREKVDRKARKGVWSQIVYQVDDSPRYSGYAPWVHVAGHSYWESNETWRPLPRREETKREDYDVLVGVNRHSLTPEGWAHEQDNYKLSLSKDGHKIIAREKGLNNYRHFADYDFAVADEYWETTKDFWADVRSRWDEIIADSDHLHIEPEMDGQKLYAHVMKIAGGLKKGEHTHDEAMEAFASAVSDYLQATTD